MLIALANYQPTDFASSIGSEPTSLGSTAPLANSAPSSFEQLLARQMGSSLPAKPFEVVGSVESHAIKTNASAPVLTGSLTNTESFSYLTMNLTASTSGATQAASGGVKGYENSNSANASSAQAGELETSSARLLAWQAATEEVMVTDFTEALKNSSDTSNTSNVQFHAGLMTNVPMTETPAEPGLGEDFFLVNEFSVETTPGSTSTNVFGGTPSQAQPLAAAATSSISDAQRPAPTKDNSAVAVSNLIPTASVVGSAHSAAAPSLVEDMAKAVTEQLHEEAVGGTTTVRIQLDREDLGSISLFLSINNNKVKVRIVAEDELARQLIDSQMDDLRESLAESGVECSEFQVVCDATHDQASRRRRSSQSPIALGFAAGSQRRDSSPEPAMNPNQLAKFNFMV